MQGKVFKNTRGHLWLQLELFTHNRFVLLRSKFAKFCLSIHIIIIIIIIIIRIIIIIIIIIIIALKGAIRDFYNLLTAPRTVSHIYAQVARAQSRANHVQHIERLSSANMS